MCDVLLTAEARGLARVFQGDCDHDGFYLAGRSLRAE